MLKIMYVCTCICTQKLSPRFLWVSKFDVNLGVGVINFENSAGRWRWLFRFLVPNLSLAAWKRRSRLPIADSRLAPAACHPRFRTDAYSHWVKPQLGVLTFAWVKMSTTIYSITASRALRTSSAVECYQEPFSFPSGFSESPTPASAQDASFSR